MFAILASLVIAGAGVVAIAVIVLTVQAQSAAVRQVLADSRAIARDREFLVHLIGDAGVDVGVNAPLGAGRLRAAPLRTVSRRSDQASFQPARLREVA
jgi:hypothetical protein